MISFMHASLFCSALCPLVILDPSKNFPKPHLLCSTKSVLSKRVNNGLGCSSLIILVTFLMFAPMLKVWLWFKAVNLPNIFLNFFRHFRSLVHELEFYSRQRNINYFISIKIFTNEFYSKKLSDLSKFFFNNFVFRGQGCNVVQSWNPILAKRVCLTLGNSMKKDQKRSAKCASNE